MNQILVGRVRNATERGETVLVVLEDNNDFLDRVTASLFQMKATITGDLVEATSLTQEQLKHIAFTDNTLKLQLSKNLAGFDTVVVLKDMQSKVNLEELKTRLDRLNVNLWVEQEG